MGISKTLVKRVAMCIIGILLIGYLSFTSYEHIEGLYAYKKIVEDSFQSIDKKNEVLEIQENDKEVSILRQDFFNQSNTVYVIKNDYYLIEDITIPDNCVLKFEGGVLRGSFSLIGNNTVVEAGLEQIFGFDVSLSGTWSVNSWNICWFGASTNLNDNSPHIKRALQVVYSLGTDIANGYGFNDCGIYIPSGVFKVSTPIDVECRFNVSGNGTSSVIYSKCPSDLFIIKGIRATISLNNVNFICDDAVRTKCNCITLNTEQGTALGRITNCDFANFNIALNLNTPYWTKITSCNFVYSNEYAIKTTDANSFSLLNCNFRGLDGTASPSCHLFFTADMQGVCISGCDFSGACRSSIMLDKCKCYGVQITGNYFEPGFNSIFLGGLIEADNCNITDMLFKANAAYESKAFDPTEKNKPRYYILLRNSVIYRSDIVGNVIVDGSINGNANSLIGRIYRYSDFTESKQNLIDKFYSYLMQAKRTNNPNEMNTNLKKMNICYDGIQKKMVDVDLIDNAIKDKELNLLSVFYRIQNVENNIAYSCTHYIEDVATSGPYAKRPSSNIIRTGFQYFNTDTHKIITWCDGKWWNPDGTVATR